MNDKGIHSHNTLRAMYWFAGKVDLCNEFDKTENDPDRISFIMQKRREANDNLADMALRAVISGDIEQEEQCR